MRSSLVHWEGAAALSFFMFWMDLYVWSVVSVGTDCSSIGVGVFGMYSVGLGGCRARSFVIEMACYPQISTQCSNYLTK